MKVENAWSAFTAYIGLERYTALERISIIDYVKPRWRLKTKQRPKFAWSKVLHPSDFTKSTAYQIISCQSVTIKQVPVGLLLDKQPGFRPKRPQDLSSLLNENENVLCRHVNFMGRQKKTTIFNFYKVLVINYYVYTCLSEVCLCLRQHSLHCLMFKKSKT